MEYLAQVGTTSIQTAIDDIEKFWRAEQRESLDAAGLRVTDKGTINHVHYPVSHFILLPRTLEVNIPRNGKHVL